MMSQSPESVEVALVAPGGARALVVPVSAPDVPRPLLDGLDDEAERFARASSSRQTVRAYEGAWKRFVKWCATRAATPMPAASETVANFVAARARDHAPSTLGIDLAAIAQAHALAGYPSPTRDPKVTKVMQGIAATLGVRPKGKDALTADPLRALIASLDDSPHGLRDRAVLLVGFAGAFRRSELMAVQVEHLEFIGKNEAVVILLPRSKTDQQGHGLEKVVQATGSPTCPVAALRAWIQAAGITSGPVFRAMQVGRGMSEEAMHPQEVARLVKRLVLVAGLDPKAFSGHSLRSGFVTEAVSQGVQLADIQDVTKHASLDTLMGYVRRGRMLKSNTTRKVGL